MPRLPTLLLGGLFALAASRAHSVVVALDNTATYTQAPAVDDFGFRSVGTVFNSIAGFPASGVYLGDGWVISAYHNVTTNGGGFAFGAVTFGGIGYTVDPSTATRLHNPTTVPPISEFADLAIFRLTTIPSDVPSVSLSGVSPLVGTPLRMMGNGQDRELDETFWNPNTSPWTEQNGGSRSGYKLIGSRALRWGTNSVETLALPTTGFYGGVVAYRADFDRVSGEAMATVGDSGGGVFAKNAGLWELAGIMFAASASSGQPEQTVAYTNQTFIVDIATYKSEIQQTMANVPEPASAALLLLGSLLVTRRRRA